GIFYAAGSQPTNPADGDLPMTEQMTGRNGPAGTERPAPLAPGGSTPSSPPGAAAGPSAPSPRDLAARSPHHPASRDSQPRHADVPLPASPQAAASVPAQHLPGAPLSAPEPPRAQVTSPGKVQATGA